MIGHDDEHEITRLNETIAQLREAIEPMAKELADAKQEVSPGEWIRFYLDSETFTEMLTEMRAHRFIVVKGKSNYLNPAAQQPPA